MNLAKTASVKSVTTDTKILDAKRVETAELLVDGVSISEVVPKWKPREHIYRCVLEEDDDYIIYDDEGNFLDCKLDTLENGTGLFQGTKGVEEFSFSLPSLTTGSNMFANCNLGEKAVESILRTIPEHSGGSHPLTMHMSREAFKKFNEITGNILGEPGTISYKGWNITSNAVLSLPDDYRKVEYLESTGTQYIDTKWLVQTPISLEIDVEGLGSDSSYYLGAISRMDKSAKEQFRYLLGHQQKTALTYDTGAGWHIIYGFLENRKSLKLDTTRLWDATAVSLKINGERYTDAHVVGAGHLPYPNESPLFLFACSINNAASIVGPLRIYSLSIHSDGKNKFAFVPCLDKTGAPCMFDLVSRKPFYNAGAGDFLYPTESTTYSLRRRLSNWGKLTEHGIRRLYHVPEGYEGSEEDYAQEFGFKQLVENERPEEGSWRPEWVETDNELILNWIEVEEEEMTDV